jgi:hypothetical protein
MRTLERDPYSAAKHLLARIDAPSGAVSVSTFSCAGSSLALRVFLRQDFRHLANKVPSEWEGFKVLCEVAELPRAYN